MLGPINGINFDSSIKTITVDTSNLAHEETYNVRITCTEVHAANLGTFLTKSLTVEILTRKIEPPIAGVTQTVAYTVHDSGVVLVSYDAYTINDPAIDSSTIVYSYKYNGGTTLPSPLVTSPSARTLRIESEDNADALFNSGTYEITVVASHGTMVH